jgi:AcrR family transcriptional regulator
MRITPVAKEETRQRIVAAAVEHFKEWGFEAATTREIARRAGIAAGTLFNYFPSKEAIVSALAAESLGGADDDFLKRKRPEASLQEDLFLYIAAGLRRLKRHRAYVHILIQGALSPHAMTGVANEVNDIRLNHLQRVQEILASHELSEVSAVAMQLYWTLYLGILSFWTRDRSPKQEDSLALVDRSVSMFCDWLTRDHNQSTPTE